ncbi:MAG: sigma 54-interacting transcriptional regulator [Desulfarculus sp.]|nr:sigma 54-interacting transcriptional regulator [Desulfarculus sp.]
MAEPSPPESPQAPSSRLILDAVAIGVFAVDTEGSIIYFNRAAEQITGMTAAQALGRPCREVFQSTLCEDDCPLKRVMRGGQGQHNLDAVLIRQGGRSVMPVKVSLAPLRNAQGRLMGGVETIQGFHLAQMLDKKQARSYTWEDFIGQSPQVQRIYETIKVVAPSTATVLIEGPTGTGKDLLAHIVHNLSPRRAKPFIKVNCAALPENLLESEMFGYLRGAFTGAGRDKPGRFQLADGGTLFLDEISEMPLSLQAKLLRVLEDMEFYPLGARKTVRVDVRVLAACNKPLDQQVQAGLFREDLYYRLNVIRLYVPPLRERRQDIPLLIRRFIQRKNVERGTYICRFSQDVLDVLLNYDYPGNVREMENILEHACLLCRGDVIRCEHLPRDLRQLPGVCPAPAAPAAPAGDLDKAQLLATLEDHQWSRHKAALALGIDRTTLWRRMKRLGIAVPSDTA